MNDNFQTDTTGIEAIMKRHAEEVQRAYKLGLLHGMNAASMAQYEAEVLSFEDYGWKLSDES